MQCSQGQKKFGDVCYNIDEHKVNWTQAKETCKRNGDRLVTIRNEKHKEFVIKLALNDSHTRTAIWIKVNMNIKTTQAQEVCHQGPSSTRT